ncbi:MAG: triose-phosphate isomerase [Actinobacteria bacterium]|nr:triose-phosphate isomerase [Actinomycetota bacterium]
MKSRKEVESYVNRLKTSMGIFDDEALEIHIMTDFLSLEYVSKKLEEFGIKAGVQDLFWEDFGPYAGEVSPMMLKDLGCCSAYLGHSERKAYFGENDKNINKKLLACLRNKIIPLVFIGETKEDLGAGMTEKVLRSQLSICLKNVSREMAGKVVIIYEPRWAIGQRESAPPESISAMHILTRKLLSEIYDDDCAFKMKILYGGSVNLKNIEEIISIKDVDGVGAARAALDPDDFIKMIRIIEKEAIKRKAKF